VPKPRRVLLPLEREYRSLIPGQILDVPGQLSELEVSSTERSTPDCSSPKERSELSSKEYKNSKLIKERTTEVTLPTLSTLKRKAPLLEKYQSASSASSSSSASSASLAASAAFASLASSASLAASASSASLVSATSSAAATESSKLLSRHSFRALTPLKLTFSIVSSTEETTPDCSSPKKRPELNSKKHTKRNTLPSEKKIPEPTKMQKKNLVKARTTELTLNTFEEKGPLLEQNQSASAAAADSTLLSRCLSNTVKPINTILQQMTRRSLGFHRSRSGQSEIDSDTRLSTESSLPCIDTSDILSQPAPQYPKIKLLENKLQEALPLAQQVQTSVTSLINLIGAVKSKGSFMLLSKSLEELNNSLERLNKKPNILTVLSILPPESTQPLLEKKLNQFKAVVQDVNTLIIGITTIVSMLQIPVQKSNNGVTICVLWDSIVDTAVILTNKVSEWKDIPNSPLTRRTPLRHTQTAKF
jgi:hypothetical protein